MLAVLTYITFQLGTGAIPNIYSIYIFGAILIIWLILGICFLFCKDDKNSDDIDLIDFNYELNSKEVTK